MADDTRDRTGQVWTADTQLVVLFVGPPEDRRDVGLGFFHPAVLLSKGHAQTGEPGGRFEFQELTAPMEEWESWERVA